MPTLKTNGKALRKAYKSNHKAANSLSASDKQARLLLDFYAAECGLKSILMARVHGSYLEDSNPLYMTHDLRLLAKELRLPSQYFPQNFSVGARDKQRVDSKECHLAWRYGVPMDTPDELAFESALSSLIQRISEEIP